MIRHTDGNLGGTNPAPVSLVEEGVAFGLDRQAGADDVAFGAQVFIPPGRTIAAGVEAERILRAHVEMLLFRAQEYIDERALVYDVVETAAGIPTVVA